MSANIMGLGKEAVIADPDAKIDYLMCTFFFAKHSQTTLCQGKVTSLPKILQEWGDHPVYVMKYIEEELQKFLGRFFTTVYVTVRSDNDDETTDITTLILDLIVSDEKSVDLSSRSVGYSLQTKDSKFVSIMNMTSGQKLYS